jgi:hypothetical protein
MRSTGEQRLPVRQVAPGGTVSGRALILDLEDQYNCLAEQSLQRNAFWRAMVDDPQGTPEHVFHGLCIENYHLLVREPYFDAPALPFPGNAEVRRLLNEFYREEVGHDRLLLKSLEHIGLSEPRLRASVPLPATMGLCNALSYWSRHDPLFFLSTLGPLEGREVEIDSFVAAANTKGLPDGFVRPIAAHAGINKDCAHGALTRQIFSAIPAISFNDAARLKRLTVLFVQIYDRFYESIWTHYRSGAPLLRELEAM